MPRISVPGGRAPFPVVVRRAPSPHDPIDLSRLMLRLHALTAALDDLPGQARRFARWRAYRDAVGAHGENRDAAGAQRLNRDAGRIRRLWPLRHGRPPGATTRLGRRHPVHDILAEAQWLAFRALESPDTS